MKTPNNFSEKSSLGDGFHDRWKPVGISYLSADDVAKSWPEFRWWRVHLPMECQNYFSSSTDVSAALWKCAFASWTSKAASSSSSSSTSVLALLLKRSWRVSLCENMTSPALKWPPSRTRRRKYCLIWSWISNERHFTLKNEVSALSLSHWEETY